jgi:glycosyltransferase involved in cell wall biosynthesis
MVGRMQGAPGDGEVAADRIKVSVVVPVYNPGKYIEPCIASLLAQSMPADELELIFVDDGSTDATPARLDALAAQHPQVKVIHRENSGWSGTPRNDGIAASRGEFIQFVDQDDMLGVEALDRLYARAKQVDADVVIGKSEGFGRRVAVTLWDRDRLHATLEKDPLIYSLTPHKMLRRGFLEEQGLRFPDGKRRLEDHVFMIKAYFAAQSISVLADYVCYFHTQREDLGNAGRHRLDPVGYFTNLREAIDVVEANTEPGAFRNRLLHRWLGSELIRRSRGRQVLNYDPDYRKVMLGEIHKLLVERFPLAVDDTLPVANIVIAALLRAGDEAALLRYARWESSLRLRPDLTSMQWSADGLHLEIRCRVDVGGGPDQPPARPLLVRTEDGAAYVEIPPDLLPPGFDPKRLRLQPKSTKGYLTIRLRDAIDRARHEVPVRFVEVPVDGTDGRWTPELILDLVVDPGARSTDSQFDPGLLDVSAEVRLGGWGLNRRVQVAEGTTLVGAALADPPHWLWPYRTTDGQLSLALQKRPPRQPAIPGHVRAVGPHRHPEGVEILLTSVGWLPGQISVALVDGSRRIELPVTDVSRGGAGVSSVRIAASKAGNTIPTGRWKVLIGIGGGAPEPAVSARLDVGTASPREVVAGLARRARRVAKR